MIRPAFIFLSVATLIFLTGCGSDQDQKPPQRRQTVVGPGAEPQPTPPSPGVPGPINSGPIAPPPPPPPGPAQNGGPAASGPAATPGTIPYAQPVPGKPGFVMSPYSPNSGYVDVRGFPPGTEVKDPYTDKVFLVP